jgi:hypothetical protein
VLDLWRKFVVGLRIRKRVQEQYGEDVEMGGSTEVRATLQPAGTKDEPINLSEGDTGGGGFLPDGPDTGEGEETMRDDTGGGGFFLDHSDEEKSEAGEFVLEDHNEDQRPVGNGKGKQRRVSDTAQYPTPVTTELTPQDEVSILPEDNDGAALLKTSKLFVAQSDLQDSDSSLSDNESDSSEQDSDIEKEDDYSPATKRRPLRTPATRPQRVSKRVTRSGGQPAQKTECRQSTGRTNVEVVVPERRSDQTPSRKVKATQVTSPYFQQPSTGRSRRNKK